MLSPIGTHNPVTAHVPGRTGTPSSYERTEKDMRLQDKTALVTGGTSGIGRAVAERLAREGAEVIVSGRDRARGSEVVAAIESTGGKARFVAADLASFEDVRRLGEEAGAVDVLVNNAGIFPGGPTDQLSEADFDATIAVNVKAPFFLTATIAPKMAAKGGGSIISISTMAATIGMNGLSAYGASKAAIESLTKAWTAEYGRRRTRERRRARADKDASQRGDGADVRRAGSDYARRPRCISRRDRGHRGVPGFR